MIKPKPKIIYDDWLKLSKDVIRKKPALVKKLAEDIDLELYLGDSSAGKDTYIIAVVSVTKGSYTLKNKYEGGHIGEGLEEMAKTCIFHIKHSWGLNHFREVFDRKVPKDNLRNR